MHRFEFKINNDSVIFTGKNKIRLTLYVDWKIEEGKGLTEEQAQYIGKRCHNIGEYLRQEGFFEDNVQRIDMKVAVKTP